MIIRRGHWCIVLSLCASACDDIALIPPEVCGNRVFEPEAGEACDGEPNCRPPGDAHACRFACAADLACPGGYVCGLDGVCRRPSGLFSVAESVDGEATLGLDVANLDNDGRADLVRTSTDTTYAHFYDSAMELSTVTAVLREASLPAIGDLTGDGRDDIAFRVSFGHGFPGGGLAVMRAKPDRSLVNTTYSTLPVPFDHAIGTSAVVFPPYNRHELIGFFENIVVGITDESSAENLIPFQDVNAGDIVGIAVGNFAEDPWTSPCDEVAFVGRGDDKIQVFQTCKRSSNGEVGYTDYITAVPAIALPTGVTVFAFEDTFGVPATTEGLSAADWNGDAHLDLVVTTTDPGDPTLSKLHVAYGVGDGTFHSSPAVPPFGGNMQASALPLVRDMQACTAETGVPLAFTDFNGDVRADMVTQNMVLVSTPDSSFSHEALYCGTGWRRAVAADFNGDGESDVVASRGDLPGLDFLAGAGDGTFGASGVDSNRIPKLMIAGDFDGDQHADAAFVAAPLAGEELETMMVSFGRSGGAPEPPMIVGEISDVVFMGEGRHEGDDATDDIAVLSRKEFLSLAVIAGDGNRQLQAPFVFPVVRKVEGSGEQPVPIVNSMAWAVHASFGAPGELGMAAITQDHPDFGGAWRMWRVRASGEAEVAVSRAPESVPEATPLHCDGCIAAAVDLGGDDIDEVVTFESLRITHYRLVAGQLESSDEIAIERYFVDPRTALSLHHPVVRDINGDGLSEVAVLDIDGNFLLFWNDGSGSLRASADGMSIVESTEPARRALDFAFLHADADGLLEVALLSASEGLIVVDVDPTARTLGEPKPLPLSPEGTSLLGDLLVAGDFDGDGIDDLALGDFYGYSVLRGGALGP
jgi:hypothetical protein